MIGFQLFLFPRLQMVKIVDIKYNDPCCYVQCKGLKRILNKVLNWMACKFWLNIRLDTWKCLVTLTNNILLDELSLPVASCICIQFPVLNFFLCLESLALSCIYPTKSSNVLNTKNRIGNSNFFCVILIRWFHFNSLSFHENCQISQRCHSQKSCAQ